jgi:hypothetical protein
VSTCGVNEGELRVMLRPDLQPPLWKTDNEQPSGPVYATASLAAHRHL